MSEPTPPTDVRAVMADGREIPLECVYRGHEDGSHVWVATVAVTGLKSITAKVLPAHTSIVVQLAVGGGGA